jgi:hypothetical protein
LETRLVYLLGEKETIMLNSKNKEKNSPDPQRGQAPPSKAKPGGKVKQKSVNKEKKVKKIPKKVKRESKLPLAKWSIRLAVGTGVILLQVGVSYTIVSKFLVPKSSEESEVGTQLETSVAHSNVQNRTSQTPLTNPEPFEPVDVSFDKIVFASINSVYTLAHFIFNPANTQG